jgi:hypothetical protein
MPLKQVIVRVVGGALFAIGLPAIMNCAGPRAGVGQLRIIGDENGGSIPQSLGNAATQSAAYRMITAHCAEFGRKSFITQMDFEGGTLTFVCISQTRPTRP